MKSKYESAECYLAYKQLDDDYKNFIIYYDDYKVYKKGTLESEKQKNNCLKYLQSIMEQKKILDINSDSDLKKVIELKFK
jgi:hypothetical protein